jgi:hypothetical protein
MLTVMINGSQTLRNDEPARPASPAASVGAVGSTGRGDGLGADEEGSALLSIFSVVAHGLVSPLLAPDRAAPEAAISAAGDRGPSRFPVHSFINAGSIAIGWNALIGRSRGAWIEPNGCDPSLPDGALGAFLPKDLV